MKTKISSTDPTAAISEMREGMIRSFNEGDFEALLSYLTDDAVVTWQDGTVAQNKNELRAYHDRMMTGGNRVVKSLVCNPEIEGRRFQGDWAISWGNMHDHFILTDGRNLPLNSRFSATIVRVGEQWKLAAFHASVNAFDNPILHTAQKITGLAGGVAGLILGVVVSGFISRRSSI